MNRNRIALIIALCMMGSVYILVADFVVQPKKKVASVAKTKEQCVEDFGDLLVNIACVMKSMSEVQCAVLEHMRAILENDKDHAVNQKNNSELQACHARIRMINESLCSIDKQLQEYALFLEHKK